MTNSDRIQASLPKGASILRRAIDLAAVDVSDLRDPSDEVTAKVLAAIASLSGLAATEAVQNKKLGGRGDTHGDGHKFIRTGK